MMDMWLFSESKLRTKFDTIGGIELRVSPRFSIDIFCKPQSVSYKKDGIDEDEVKCEIGAVSGGVSITFWKINEI